MQLSVGVFSRVREKQPHTYQFLHLIVYVACCGNVSGRVPTSMGVSDPLNKAKSNS